MIFKARLMAPLFYKKRGGGKEIYILIWKFFSFLTPENLYFSFIFYIKLPSKSVVFLLQTCNRILCQVLTPHTFNNKIIFMCPKQIRLANKKAKK